MSRLPFDQSPVAICCRIVGAPIRRDRHLACNSVVAAFVVAAFFVADFVVANLVVANSHANMQLQGELPFAPTIRQSLFANRCRFPSWLIATPTSLPFDQSPIAIRYSLPFRG
jgi:hypothetical protein